MDAVEESSHAVEESSPAVDAFSHGICVLFHGCLRARGVEAGGMWAGRVRFVGWARELGAF